MHRILFTGGRDADDMGGVRHLLEVGAAVLGYEDPFAAPIVLVHGDCKRYLPDGRVDPMRSADQLARQVALQLGWKPEPHEVTAAMKARYGPYRAPVERNQIMVDLGADLCLAFTGGRGTADCVRRARAAGIRVISFEKIEPPTLF